MLRALGIVILLIAYGLLWPGLTQPMLNVSGTVEKEKLVDVGREIIEDNQDSSGLLGGLANLFMDRLEVSGNVTAFDKTQSILGTARELRDNDHLAVAVLIVTFSVVVPAFKGLLLLGACLPIRRSARHALSTVGNALSKWSMADVFVIAIFISFLATSGLERGRSLLELESRLDVGFWYFLGYCLLSILGSQILYSADRIDAGKDA